ncbi:probable aspartyl protease At4g16563 [Euphorbia lathyris]|uniref:probable aspartyl protease At4g16563 n=1 Tax=Euphorbia lathyris TaxID=212925 RepID=UPI003313D2B1
MASVSVSLSLLYCILLLLLLSITFSLASSITIPLSHNDNSNTIQNPFQNLNQLVLSSLARAHHLKYPHHHPHPTAKTQIFSHSYGVYSISLSFGTPPQTMSFVFDTGSDIVWFPCTHHYDCKNCTFESSAGKISPFIPKRSSSTKTIACKNPKCSWIHDEQVHCPQCNNKRNCSQICPPYFILYGSGFTGGTALSETLHLNALTVPNFLVGCSVFSTIGQPAGIAGFGRGPASLPNQLGLTKFSYCLISRKFDDTPKSSLLVLDSYYNTDKKTPGLVYTPFLDNPKVKDNPTFSVYYYIGLRRISVGSRSVKIPYKYSSPGKDGNGGTIIDSGRTFTFMAGDAFEKLSSELISQVKNYKRAVQIEQLTGLKPCFNASGAKILQLPKLTLHFKGGAKLELPTENSFAFGEGVACLMVVTDGVEGLEERSGPGIVLGSFQMQNFHVEFDLRNQRLGFNKEQCK